MCGRERGSKSGASARKEAGRVRVCVDEIDYQILATL